MSGTLEWVVRNCEVYFALEIVMCFNTGFFDEGKFIKDRKAIFRNYVRPGLQGLVCIAGLRGCLHALSVCILRSWFLLDLVATVPFDLLTEEVPSHPQIFVMLSVSVPICLIVFSTVKE